MSLKLRSPRPPTSNTIASEPCAAALNETAKRATSNTATIKLDLRTHSPPLVAMKLNVGNAPPMRCPARRGPFPNSEENFYIATLFPAWKRRGRGICQRESRRGVRIPRASFPAGKRCFFGMDPALWLLPVVGAFIGWVTNVIAVRMLFRPKRPVRVPLTSLTLQGVLPRRHADLAASIGRTVSEELLPVAELVKRLDVAAIKEEMVAAVSEHVDRRLDTSVPKWLPPGVRTSLSS